MSFINGRRIKDTIPKINWKYKYEDAESCIENLQSELAKAKEELKESEKREERLFEIKLFADKLVIDNLNLIKERDRYRKALEKIAKPALGGQQQQQWAQQALAGGEK